MPIVESETVPGVASEDGLTPAGSSGGTVPYVRRLPLKEKSYEPPISLYASALVPAGSEVVMQSKALANFTGRAIEIHEIRIAVVCTTVEGDPFDQSALGNFLALQLSIGNVAITDGYVPVSALCKVENLADENRVQATQPPRLMSSYVWHLSRPFYVPPEAQVNAQVRHLGLINAGLVAHVSLAGRVVAKRARTSAVPFASAYLSPSFEYATQNQFLKQDVSKETELFNSTGSPLHVYRFVGRINAFGQVVAQPNLIASDQWGRVSQNIRIRMVASTGEPIIRDPTLFRLAFSGTSRALECDGYVMPPGAYNRVTIDKVAGFSPNVGFNFLKVQVLIGMLGWREVAL
jgi:hypothetical protein